MPQPAVTALRFQLAYRPLGINPCRSAGLAVADLTPLREVPKDLVVALLASEDPRFFRHPGFDLWAIRLALRAWWRGKRPVPGASTLVQQLAKNLFLYPKRSLVRKLRELGYALLLEWHFSKEEILTLYLNNIEWGENVYGLAAAARYHFQKAVADLSPEDCAFLVSILPNPKVLAPGGGYDSLGPKMRKRVSRVLEFVWAGRGSGELRPFYAEQSNEVAHHFKRLDLRPLFYPVRRFFSLNVLRISARA